MEDFDARREERQREREARFEGRTAHSRSAARFSSTAWHSRAVIDAISGLMATPRPRHHGASGLCVQEPDRARRRR